MDPEDLDWLSDCRICLSAVIIAFQLLLVESLMPLGCCVCLSAAMVPVVGAESAPRQHLNDHVSFSVDLESAQLYVCCLALSSSLL